MPRELAITENHLKIKKAISKKGKVDVGLTEVFKDDRCPSHALKNVEHANSIQVLPGNLLSG